MLLQEVTKVIVESSNEIHLKECNLFSYTDGRQNTKEENNRKKESIQIIKDESGWYKM